METILWALWPVCALLVIGFLARLFGFPGAAFWPGAERATYYVFFPALLVVRLSQAQLEGGESLRLVAAVLILLALATVLLLVLRRLLLNSMSGAQWTSVYQGGMRFNTFVALAVSAQLMGEAGVVYGAVIAAVMIPTLNLLCILIFATSGGKRRSPWQVLKVLIANPLILACILGIGLNLSGIGLSHAAADVLELLARMALPLGLLAVGAALQLKMLSGERNKLFLPTVIKLVIFPLMAFFIAAVLGLNSESSRVLIVFAAVPTATSAYILARQLGGDAVFMAAIITAQTLVSLLTMPVMLMLLD